MKASRVALAVVVAGLLGLSIFGTLIFRAVNVREATPTEALARFTVVRKMFANQTRMIEVDGSGRVTRSAASSAAKSGAPGIKRLEVLGYRAAEQRLVEAHVPFWFFSLKDSAVQFALRDTGLDLERLHLTADDLAQHGPGLILDQKLPNGDRLLVWTE
jgi:hypothetical protein